MQQEETRNLILAMGLMFLVAIGYQFFVLAPAQEQYRAEQEAAEITKLEETSDPTVVDIAEAVEKISVDEALEGSERVSFDSASLDGSIRLKGSRIDDLNLKDYYQTLERENEIRLFRPAEAEHGYYATYYWMKDGATPIAGPSSVWIQTGGKQLSESSPITLEISKGDYAITREISIDQDYMFTFKDTVTNTGSTPVTAFPYGSIVRYGEQEGFVAATDPGSGNAGYLAHMGLMGVMDGKLKLKKYGGLFGLKKIKGENDRRQIATESGGWWGLSDKYWLGALVPDQTEPFFGAVNNELIAKEGPLEIQTRTQTARSLNPGESITVENRIFAGAKRLDVLRGYQKDLNVPKMIDAIDWGWAHFLTKPFFFMLQLLERHLGSFGLAILAFTVLIKIPLLPLYNRSYKSMAKMKKLQEPMKELQERFAADPQRKQQEIMKLYKQEGANPVGGCLPILMTIPIFYALYKTLFVTIEMRHEPFLYMKDLSAPDPTAIGNLFGLLPWAAADVKAIPILGFVIGIGILPILYGVTMASIQTLSPPPPDPSQARMMRLLPFIFMFVFGGFAAGLVIYWVWNNILSFIQQYFIMRRNGVETEIGKFFAKRFGNKKSVDD